MQIIIAVIWYQTDMKNFESELILKEKKVVV